MNCFADSDFLPEFVEQPPVLSSSKGALPIRGYLLGARFLTHPSLKQVKGRHPEVESTCASLGLCCHTPGDAFASPEG